MQNRLISMPINIDRPRSALMRGVQITEFKGHIINPDPIILQETDLLLEEFLSPTKLKALTGVNDLSSVEHLEMIVDTSETSLGNFGIYLPNLRQLKLNGSHVPRIRDLGTSLIHLRVLWLSRSGLVDLDGIPTLNNLKELYLAYNEISDISPCSLLENLVCLDLEGNLIEDIKQVEFLNLCPSLKNLTLFGNPICSKPTLESNENDPSYSYRHEIVKLLPSLETLDDELTLNTKPKSPGKSSKGDNKLLNEQCPFDDDWQLINQLLDEGIGPPEENLAINESIRPGTSTSRSSSSVRPLTAMRPLSSYRIKTSSKARPSSRLTTTNSLNTPQTSSSSSRPSSSIIRPNTDPVSDIINDASHLTVGPTFQGNPLKSLLARKKQPLNTLTISTAHKLTSNNNNRKSSIIAEPVKNKKQPADTDMLRNVECENQELREEILKWKHEHRQKMEARKKYFEPQVLQINDDDDQFNQPGIEADDDADNLINDEYDEYHQPVESDNEFEFKRNNASTVRVKSAFKKSFDTSSKAEDNLSPSSSKDRRPRPDKDQVKSNRTKSSEKHHRKGAAGLDNSLSSLGSSAASESFVDRDVESVRVRTSDTGYESSLSNLSLQSNKSNSLNLKAIIKTGANSRPMQAHQPIIASANHVNTTKPSLISPINTNSNGNTTNNQNITSLRQLKNNLTPLPGIRMPK